MFGFTAKKKLFNEITNSLISHRDEFRDRMRAQAAELLDDKSQNMDAVFLAVNQSLFAAVDVDVTEFVNSTSPQAARRLSEAKAGPESEKRDCENTFARCYLALCGKEAPARDRIAVRQLQNLVIQDVMQQLAQDEG